MNDTAKIILGVVILIAVAVGVSYSSGWIGVHQTRTIGNAQKNAEREVYEATNSFTRGKRKEALKLYKEWQHCDSTDKAAIETLVQISFADFDEYRFIKNADLRAFIQRAKYGRND